MTEHRDKLRSPVSNPAYRDNFPFKDKVKTITIKKRYTYYKKVKYPKSLNLLEGIV